MFNQYKRLRHILITQPLLYFFHLLHTFIFAGICTACSCIVLLEKNSGILAEIPEKIIIGCKKGDRRAMEELYRLVAPRMYGVCLHYAGNDDDASDILHDGFMKVYEKIYQFEGKGSFEGWIRRIIINTAIGMLRKKVWSQSLDDSPVAFEKEIVHDDILESLEAEDLIAVIRELSPAYRTVFNLYAIEGYSHKEIGEMLGISESSSKSNLSRARQVLQRKIESLYNKAALNKKEGNESGT